MRPASSPIENENGAEFAALVKNDPIDDDVEASSWLLQAIQVIEPGWKRFSIDIA